MPGREIRLNAFDMATPGHIQQGMWRHARDNSTGYARLDHWTGLARRLEAGLFDALFLADVLGAADVYEGSPDAALRGGVQIPQLDPLLLAASIAAVTSEIGLAVTCNPSFEPPALLARRLSTLDHLTAGRAGWNIVTGYLDSAARAMGAGRQPDHDARYDEADDILDTLYALWEGSWHDDAVVRDRARGIYTEPGRVRAVQRHAGRWRTDAVHLAEPSTQRTPVLFQAGASPRGRRFAARHAECVFLNGTRPEVVAPLVADLRAQAAPRPILAFAGATVVVGRTEREARTLLADYAASASSEAALAHASASLGIDFSRFGMDEPVGSAPPAPSQGIQSNVEAMRAVAGAGWTKRMLLRESVLGSRQPPIVGDPQQVADAMLAWVDQADVDGFNLSRTVMPECLDSFVELVVPVLQERGVYKTAYGGGTLRQRLFGGGARLPATHRAERCRAWDG